MKARNQARLKIVGKSLSPEEITVRVGLSPDRVRRAGETRPHTTIIETKNIWELHSNVPEEDDLAEHIASVLRRVEVIADRIAELAQEHDILLSCIVHSSSEPALGLSKAAIQGLARLQAEVDFDLYIGEQAV